MLLLSSKTHNIPKDSIKLFNALNKKLRFPKMQIKFNISKSLIYYLIVKINKEKI